MWNANKYIQENSLIFNVNKYDKLILHIKILFIKIT